MSKINLNVYTYLRTTGYMTYDQADEVARHLSENLLRYLRDEDRDGLICMAAKFADNAKPSGRELVDAKRFARNILAHNDELEFNDLQSEVASLQEDVNVMERLVNKRGVHTRELAKLQGQLAEKTKQLIKLRTKLMKDDVEDDE